MHRFLHRMSGCINIISSIQTGGFFETSDFLLGSYYFAHAHSRVQSITENCPKNACRGTHWFPGSFL